MIYTPLSNTFAPLLALNAPLKNNLCELGWRACLNLHFLDWVVKHFSIMLLSNCFSSLINLVHVLCLRLYFYSYNFFLICLVFFLVLPAPKFGSVLIYLVWDLYVFIQSSFYLSLLRWYFLISLFEFCLDYFWCLFNFVHGGFCQMEVSNFYVVQSISLLLCGFAFEVMLLEVLSLLQSYLNISEVFIQYF